jgi:quercetin dioxygenase-like cupin family protein
MDVPNAATRAPSNGLTTEVLGHGKTAGPVAIHRDGIRIESNAAVDLVVARLTFAPGGVSDWEFRSGPVLVVMTRGSLTRYAADDANAETFATGTAFVETGPSDGCIVRNEGVLDAEAVAVFVGAPRRQANEKRR